MAIIIAIYIKIKRNKKAHQSKGCEVIELLESAGLLGFVESSNKRSPSAKKPMSFLSFKKSTQVTQPTQQTQVTQ
jgi:hypothetical protein